MQCVTSSHAMRHVWSIHHRLATSGLGYGYALFISSKFNLIAILCVMYYIIDVLYLIALLYVMLYIIFDSYVMCYIIAILYLIPRRGYGTLPW